MLSPDMQRYFAQTQNRYKERLENRKYLFWSAFVGGVGLLIFAVLAVRHFGSSPTNDQLLKSAPQFIVLSLVVIFAAYLRQVSANAVEQRTNILGGKVWNYPPDQGYDYVTRKLEALDGTVYALSIAAPFLITLAIAAAVRIGMDGASKFGALAGKIPWLLYYIDLVIAGWLLLLFGALAVVHFLARAEEEKIQIEARKKEPELFEKLMNRAQNQSATSENTSPTVAETARTNSAKLGGAALFCAAVLLGLAVSSRGE